MGRYVFKLPDVGEGTAEAEIVVWHVAPGQAIEEDDPLVDVLTDKATVEMTSPVTGKVLETHGEPGEMAAVGAPLAVIEIEGDAGAEPAAPPPPRPTAPPPRPGPASAPAPAPPPRREPTPLAPPSTTTGRPLASPAVRRQAQEAGVALQFVTPTGPGGRITAEDLAAFVASGGRGPAVAGGLARREGAEELKVIGLRRRIAEKMVLSKSRIPHYAYVEEADVTELEALRAHLNARAGEGRPRLTILPFVVRTLVEVLPAFPQINATFDDEAGVVTRHRPVHAGIATQTANGLLVPVLRHAEALDLWQCAAEIARLAAAAREGHASAEELRGSTITITSLGPLGGLATTPVINHPEVAIVGPNKVEERPVVRGGQIVVRKMMNVSSSFDHRVVDGYDAAAFIGEVKARLEHPATLFLPGL